MSVNYVKEAKNRGFDDYKAGKTLEDNPYKWLKGYKALAEYWEVGFKKAEKISGAA